MGGTNELELSQGPLPGSRTPRGSWSERRLQRSAEETAAANAQRFAAETAEQVYAAYDGLAASVLLAYDPFSAQAAW
jgi:hypothetical protein